MNVEEAIRAMCEGTNVEVTNAGKTYIGRVDSISKKRFPKKFSFHGKLIRGEEQISVFLEACDLNFHKS